MCIATQRKGDMALEENSLFGLKVPEGTDRRELCGVAAFTQPCDRSTWVREGDWRSLI